MVILFMYLTDTPDHVLGEITMARCINHGDVVLVRLEFPQRDVTLAYIHMMPTTIYQNIYACSATV